MIRAFLPFSFAFMICGLVTTGPPTAEELALSLLDSEAMCILGGLKPISDGFWQTRFRVDQTTTDDIQSVRATLRSLPLGPHLEAGVYVFEKPYQGKKTASVYILHRPSFAALVKRRCDVFRPLGIEWDLSGQQDMERIDRAERSARWRAFGLVFGYPEYAVEFFVTAGESEAKTSQFTDRDFRAIPTVSSGRGLFVYAVPRGHQDRTEDLDLALRAGMVFDRYIAHRNRFIGPGFAGPMELLQAMVSAPSSVCSCETNRSRGLCRSR